MVICCKAVTTALEGIFNYYFFITTKNSIEMVNFPTETSTVWASYSV